MKFDHMCILVSDLDNAIDMWRDLLDFKIVIRKIVPDGLVAGPDVLNTPELLDDIFKTKNASAEAAIMVSDDGAMIELMQVQTPRMEKLPANILGGYAYTGFHEMGFLVDNIDDWFRKVRTAGYKTQTDYVWSVGAYGRTFLFYDEDGNLIQLREHSTS